MKKISYNVVPHLRHLNIGVKLIPSGKHIHMNFHDHPFNELAIVLSSSDTIHWAEGKHTEVKRGDVLLIRPSEVHAYGNTGGFSVLNFLYEAENLPLPQLDGAALPLYQEICSPRRQREDPALPVAHLDDDALLELMVLSDRIIRELESESPGSNLRVFGLFIAAMVTICRSGRMLPQSDIPEVSALPILHYINLHFKENISIGKLTALSKMSRNTLFRRFRELTGYSPMEYQRCKRLEQAKELLEKSDMSIGEIAFACGFCDSNHLIKHFSRRYQESPGMARKRSRGKLSEKP